MIEAIEIWVNIGSGNGLLPLGGGEGVGALPLWESVGMWCGFAPHFQFSAPGWHPPPPPQFDLIYHFIQILLGPISKPPIFSM